jgi:hypothetical protein
MPSKAISDCVKSFSRLSEAKAEAESGTFKTAICWVKANRTIPVRKYNNHKTCKFVVAVPGTDGRKRKFFRNKKEALFFAEALRQLRLMEIGL